MTNVVKIDYVKNYPNDNNFILSVDSYFCDLLDEKKFLSNVSELMASWGMSIIDDTIGIVDTPNGISDWNSCFSVSQKIVLFAAYLKEKYFDKEIELNMTEVVPELFDELFDVIKDSNITLITKVWHDYHLNKKFNFIINGLPINNE